MNILKMARKVIRETSPSKLRKLFEESYPEAVELVDLYYQNKDSMDYFDPVLQLHVAEIIVNHPRFQQVTCMNSKEILDA